MEGPGPEDGSERSLARGAALMTVATAVSRATGFIRVLVVAAAMGTTYLANTYQTANTAPNVVFELVAAGVLTSVFVPTFVSYIARGDKRGTWDAANALTSAALVGLVGLSVVLGLAAPLIMRALTLGVEDPAVRDLEIEIGTRLLWLFAPQVALYGTGMIMTAALHSHRRFGLAAVAPIFNNVVVIAVYLIYAEMRGNRVPTLAGIEGPEILVLGAGTTLGVVAMTACLIPGLRRLGWRFRFSFDLRHPAVRGAARLGVWALGYAGGYQAGLVVVLLLANRIEGGVAAYQWAFTFFFVPHALFAVPIFNALFPAMAEHAQKKEEGSLGRRLRDGLGMLMFILFPVSAWLIVLAQPLAAASLDYGVMDPEGARLVGRVIAAFALGLPTYSAFLVYTRAFYALGDTRTPTFINAGAILAASIVGAALFWLAPVEWAVAGLALGHSVGFAVGTSIIAAKLTGKIGTAGATASTSGLVRITTWSAAATAAMAGVIALVPAGGKGSAAIELTAATVAGAVVYLWGMARAGAPEFGRLTQIVRGARG